MSDRLFLVDLYGEPVGVIRVRGNLTTFEFLDDYLNQPDRPVLGQVFEEDPQQRWRQSQRVPTWFSNLLPEDGPLRDFLASRLDISPRSEVRLLEALGSDMPGALAIRQTNFAVDDALSRFDLEGRDESAMAEIEGGLRFSVAGVQLKLSMVQDRNSIRLAGRGEWGNRYVKFAGGEAGIPRNEYAMMSLASRCGLDVPIIDLVPAESISGIPSSFDRLKGSDVFVIHRFDRSGSGLVHIEDFNQVIGNWPNEKYQGASFESLGGLILALCGEDDFWEYFRRLVFFLAVGNEDAHLKNWSLIYRDRITPRLSPVYDVVSTVVLPDFTREIALKLGRQRSAQSVDMPMMIQLVDRAGLDGAIARSEVEQVLERIRDEEPELRGEDFLSADQWQSMGDYRRSVPLLSPFF